jgi:hypothetical protein
MPLQVGRYRIQVAYTSPVPQLVSSDAEVSLEVLK